MHISKIHGDMTSARNDRSFACAKGGDQESSIDSLNSEQWK